MSKNTLTIRKLACPHCGFTTAEIYSDTAGHLKTKCEKCKRFTVFYLIPGKQPKQG